MARYSHLIFLLGLALLTGCAQVGTITGGSDDVYAPKPTDGVYPPNASLNFDAQEIKIPFDEYFKLNDPRNTIRIVPPHATLETTVKGKTLYISFEEKLQENTTYAIYFNNAIKDLSEGNDSIMQYVFSTGSILDSLTYTVSVIDAYTSAPVENCIVALFDPESQDLLNFTQTSKSGEATLRYLSARTYLLIAFKDENNNLTYESNERVGFFNDSLLVLDSSSVSTEPIRMFSPLKRPKITSLTYTSPGTFLLGANRRISDANLIWDGTELRKDQYKIITSDSLQLFFEDAALSSGQLIVNATDFTDTISYRVLENQKKGKIELKSAVSTSVFGPEDTISFVANSLITSIDTARIHFLDKKDSSEISVKKFTFSQNMLYAFIDRNEAVQDVLVKIDSAFLATQNGVNQAINTTFSTHPERKFGSINLNVSFYTQPIIVELFQGKNVIRTLTITDPSTPISLKWLVPGTYTFRLILDNNENGKWDAGDFSKRIQPEQIANYSLPTQVRGNWNVDVELIPTSEKDEEPAE